MRRMVASTNSATSPFRICFRYFGVGSCMKRVQRHKGRYKCWRNALQISSEFADGNIAAEVALMNTLEGAQERPDIGPHAFNGIAMNFAKAVAIGVPRPFMLAVTNGIVHTLEVIVTL